MLRNVYMEGELKLIKQTADMVLERDGTVEPAIISNVIAELLVAREVLEKHKLTEEFESHFELYEETK